MKVRVNKYRDIISEHAILGTQYENGATTLEFDFPETITFDGTEYNTFELTKIIEFRTSEDSYIRLIKDNKYTLTSQETKELTIDMQIVLSKIITDENDEPIDKKIWSSKIVTIALNDRINATEELDPENPKIEIIDLLIEEVNDLKNEYLELIEKGVPGSGGGGEGQPTNITSTTLDIGGSGYSRTVNIKATDLTKWNNKSDFSGDFNDLDNKPIIPTRTSELTNDSDFTTKSYVDNIVGDIESLLSEV